MCGGRTVPPVEESLPPTARPLPTSRQLPRTIFSPPQQCSTPGSSVPTCPRRQFWSIRELQTMPRSRTVPEGAANPQPSARPLPTSRQSPRTIFSPPKKCSSAGSSVPTCPRRQFWSIGEPSTMPRSRTVPDAAEEPQPSRRQPQTRLRHDEPPRQWSMQWHTVRAALQPGPDPLDFIHDRGQAPALPRPLPLTYGHVRGCDDKPPHIRFHPESSKPRPSPPPDYRPPVPHTGPGRPGSDERGHPPFHLFARASSGSSPLLCTRRRRQLSTPLHAQAAVAFHFSARAGGGSFPLLCTRGQRQLSTSLHAQAAVAFHFFARAGSATFHFFARAGGGS